MALPIPRSVEADCDDGLACSYKRCTFQTCEVACTYQVLQSSALSNLVYWMSASKNCEDKKVLLKLADTHTALDWIYSLVPESLEAPINKQHAILDLTLMIPSSGKELTPTSCRIKTKLLLAEALHWI